MTEKLNLLKFSGKLLNFSQEKGNYRPLGINMKWHKRCVGGQLLVSMLH